MRRAASGFLSHCGVLEGRPSLCLPHLLKAPVRGLVTTGDEKFLPASMKGILASLPRPSPGEWASLSSASTCLFCWENMHLGGARSGRP